jgi:hypothetical protein
MINFVATDYHLLQTTSKSPPTHFLPQIKKVNFFMLFQICGMKKLLMADALLFD